MPTVTHAEAEDLFAAARRFDAGPISMRLEKTKGLFGILVLEGAVSPFITDTDPIQEGRPLIMPSPWAQYAEDPATVQTAAALRDYLAWVYQVLHQHPVNSKRVRRGMLPIRGLVTQRAGRLKPINSFKQQNGLRALSISSGIVYWGLSSYLQIDTLKVKDTGNPAVDLAERLSMARAALKNYDFIHLHTKAPDEAGHSRNPSTKKSVIEALDRGLGREIYQLLADPDLLIVVTADHSTPSCGSLIHSGEPVPLAICGAGVRHDTVHHFDEICAAQGALGCVRGQEFMYLILNYLDRAKLAGLMDTPQDQNYWPGNYRPFSLE